MRPCLWLYPGNLISDYTFDKDLLFARLNLEGDELEMYNRVHQALAERLIRPDLILYLRADTDTALKRIALRDRSYERNMDRAYIDDLNRAYDEFFSGPQAAPVLAVDTNPLDFVGMPSHLNAIAGRIRAALGIIPFQPELPLQGGTPA